MPRKWHNSGESGITPEQYYRGMVEAWNRAIDEEVGKDWAWF